MKNNGNSIGADWCRFLVGFGRVGEDRAPEIYAASFVANAATGTLACFAKLVTFMRCQS